MRRWGAATTAVLVACLGLAACGHGKAKGNSGPQAYGDASLLDDAGHGGAPGASTTVAGGASATGAKTASGGGKSAPLTTPTTRAGGSGGGSSTPTAGSGSGGSSDPQPQIMAAASGPTGTFARTLLQPQPATSIVTEVFFQPSAAPRPGTTQHLTSVLSEESGKQVTVQTTPLTGSAKSWSDADLRKTADEHTRFRQGAGGVAVLHLLFLHGDFHGDTGVLGVAVRGDVLAIFVDQVQSSSTVAVPQPELEDAVTIHETGHELGLVDLALHTGRQDPDHPGHSPNKGSVMYWAVDTNLVAQLLQGGPPKSFDDADRRDLATLRRGG